MAHLYSRTYCLCYKELVNNDFVISKPFAFQNIHVFLYECVSIILEGDSHAGVRYITEALIKKLTKQDNLAMVKSLNLSLSKDGGKKFKVGY